MGPAKRGEPVSPVSTSQKSIFHFVRWHFLRILTRKQSIKRKTWWIQVVREEWQKFIRSFLSWSEHSWICRRTLKCLQAVFVSFTRTTPHLRGEFNVWCFVGFFFSHKKAWPSDIDDNFLNRLSQQNRARHPSEGWHLRPAEMGSENRQRFRNVFFQHIWNVLTFLMTLGSLPFITSPISNEILQGDDASASLLEFSNPLWPATETPKLQQLDNSCRSCKCHDRAQIPPSALQKKFSTKQPNSTSLRERLLEETEQFSSVPDEFASRLGRG